MDDEIIFKKSKKSQLTILIIVALIVVVSIVLVFTLMNKSATTIKAEENPQAYISNCLKNSLEKAETEILEGNGYSNLTSNYILMSINKPGEKVPYLCMASQFYKPCVNQEPMLIGHIKQEFEKRVKPEAESCFSSLVKNLKSKGYSVTEEKINFEIKFYTSSVAAEINKKITMSKGEDSRSYEMFVGELNSPIPGLIDTARNIVNFESTLCEFNLMNWMKEYRDISIKKFITSDQTKVYTLTDKISEKKLSFAVRTCVLPAGI